jgi:hypothetical protein
MHAHGTTVCFLAFKYAAQVHMRHLKARMILQDGPKFVLPTMHRVLLRGPCSVVPALSSIA